MGASRLFVLVDYGQAIAGVSGYACFVYVSRDIGTSASVVQYVGDTVLHPRRYTDLGDGAAAGLVLAGRDARLRARSTSVCPRAAQRRFAGLRLRGVAYGRVAFWRAAIVRFPRLRRGWLGSAGNRFRDTYELYV